MSNVLERIEIIHLPLQPIIFDCNDQYELVHYYLLILQLI